MLKKKKLEGSFYQNVPFHVTTFFFLPNTYPVNSVLLVVAQMYNIFFTLKLLL